MPVSTTTISADFKNVYGEGLKNQVGQAAVIFNLFKDGKKFAKPIATIGANGYTFGCRLKRNYRMGYRPEGTSGVGVSGNQGLGQGTVVLKYAYIPQVLTGQATNLSQGNYRAFMSAKALQMEYDVKDLLEHINVIVAGAERGGQLAQILTGATASSFVASRASNLPGALYLQVGMPVDAGPVGGGTLTIVDNTITAITYDAVAGDTVTLTDSDTFSTGDAVTLTGELPASSGDFPYTAEGFISLIAATGSRQGLNPATAGQESWTSYANNAGGADLTSQYIDQVIQFVENLGGVNVDTLFFPSSQINQLVNLATMNLRYNVDQSAVNGITKKAMDLGFTTFTYAGRTIIKDKNIRNDRFYAMDSEAMAHFVAIPLSMAEDEASQWTRLIGSSASVADAVAALMRIYHQIGILQRSGAGYGYGLSVPAAFQTAPQSLN